MCGHHGQHDMRPFEQGRYGIQ